MNFKIERILSDPENRHTLVNGFIVLLIRILGAGMAFLFNLIIAKKLGAEQSGYFFLSLALVMLLSSVARLGFDNTVLRFTSADAECGYTVKTILNFALKYVLFVSIVFISIFYNFAPWLAEYIFDKPELELVIQLIAPAITGFSVVSLVAMSLQARNIFIVSIPCHLIAHFLLCGSAVILFDVGTASTAALYLSLSLGLTSCFFYWLCIKDLNNVGNKPNPQEIFHSTNSNWVTDVMNQVIQWAPPIIVGFFLVAEQVAFYSVAQRIAVLTSFILIAVNQVVSPKFAFYNAIGDKSAIRKTALFSVRLLVFSALLIVPLMLLFPEVLMSLFGEDYKQGVLILQVLVLGQAVNVVTGSVGHLLMMSGHERDVRFVTLISGLGVLIIVPIFTKLFGAVGAASASAFFISLQNLLAVYFVNKRFGFNMLKFWQNI